MMFRGGAAALNRRSNHPSRFGWARKRTFQIL